MVARFAGLAQVGVQHVIFNMTNVWDPRNMETLARDVIPAVHAIEPKKI